MWTIVSSILFSIFGIVFSDVYSFKEIFEHIKFYWNEYVNFIHETKISKVLTKILKFFKEFNLEKENVTEVKINSKSEIVENIKKEELNFDISEDIKKEELNIPSSKLRTSYSSSTESKIWNEHDIERNNKIDRSNIGDSSEVNREFFQNKYFFIAISIISVSLIYYYWDNISELLNIFRKPDPDNKTTYDLRELIINNTLENTSENTSPLTLKEQFQEYFKHRKSTNENLYDLDEIKLDIKLDKSDVINYSDI